MIAVYTPVKVIIYSIELYLRLVYYNMVPNIQGKI